MAFVGWRPEQIEISGETTKAGTYHWWAEGEGQGQNGVDWKGSADEANKAEKEVSGNGEYILIFEHRQETRDWELSGNALPF